MGVRWVSRQDDICLQMACLRQLTVCAHFIRNEQVAGSSPVTSSTYLSRLRGSQAAFSYAQHRILCAILIIL